MHPVDGFGEGQAVEKADGIRGRDGGGFALPRGEHGAVAEDVEFEEDVGGQRGEGAEEDGQGFAGAKLAAPEEAQRAWGYSLLPIADALVEAGAVGIGDGVEAGFKQALDLDAREGAPHVLHGGEVGAEDDGGAAGGDADAAAGAEDETIEQRASEFFGGFAGWEDAEHAGGKVLRAAEGSPEERDAELVEQAGFTNGADGALVRHVKAVLAVKLPGEGEGKRVPVAVGGVVVVEVDGLLFE